MTMRFTRWRQAIAEIRQLLSAHHQLAVREGAEHFTEMKLMGQVVFAGAGLGEQTVIKLATFRRQRHPALLNFTKARGMGAFMFPGKQHRLFQRLEAGLTQ